jgi:hypothetical protein
VLDDDPAVGQAVAASGQGYQELDEGGQAEGDRKDR